MFNKRASIFEAFLFLLVIKYILLNIENAGFTLVQFQQLEGYYLFK